MAKNRPYRRALVRVAMPGTCGELVQGTLAGGTPCLISCPIDMVSTAYIHLTDAQAWRLYGAQNKAHEAFWRTLAFLGKPQGGGEIVFRSGLPSGRGYASSTADIGVAIHAAAVALGHEGIPTATVARIAVSIEPTDSSIFAGLAMWDHRTGSFVERLGQPPEAAIVVVDPGGGVNTELFNGEVHRAALTSLAPKHQQAFTMARKAIREHDVAALGAAATISAQAHQSILFNPMLEPVTTLARAVGAAGVCRAHSGTLMGLILDPEKVDVPAVAEWIQGKLEDQARVFTTRLVGGGASICATVERLSSVKRNCIQEAAG